MYIEYNQRGANWNATTKVRPRRWPWMQVSLPERPGGVIWQSCGSWGLLARWMSYNGPFLPRAAYVLSRVFCRSVKVQEMTVFKLWTDQTVIGVVNMAYFGFLRVYFEFILNFRSCGDTSSRQRNGKTFTLGSSQAHFQVESAGAWIFYFPTSTSPFWAPRVAFLFATLVLFLMAHILVFNQESHVR